MQSVPSKALERLWRVLAALLICKVTVSVLWNYRDYLPPDFSAAFLIGREGYFFGSYSWAFYPHILAGPCTLIIGLLLLSERFRRRFPKWHRILGRIQVACVLLLVAPSGLWMARYAETGAVAAVGFATLAILTGASAVLGWRLAVQRRFAEHRRWMWRCYILLCSAVVLRLLGGLATVADVGADWPYQFAAWISWMVPLSIFELTGFLKRRARLE